MTQPQFSLRIRALELWAGAELANRATVPIALTPAGDTLLTGSKVAVNALDDARARIAHLGGGGKGTTLFTGRTLSRTVVPQWLASGIGFAPFKGITRPAVLYWGGRRPADLYMNDWVLAKVAEMPNLTYVSVISDALPDDNWTSRTGFVHKAMLQDFADLSS